jgi:sec-independent protein translocase protein TatB
VLGVSFSEIVMIAIVALIVVGPRRLPEMLGTLGRWVAKLRHMTTEVRRQTGIDEILREEGISGGINELRTMLRGEVQTLQNLHRMGAAGTGTASAALPAPSPNSMVDAYGEAIEFDDQRERPVEGPDCYGAIPEDLLAGAAPVHSAPAAPATQAEPVTVAAPAEPAPSPAFEQPARPGEAKESA